MERSMDIGEKVEDVIKDLNNSYYMEEINRDLHCILVDTCEGGSYDKIKGLQNKTGAEVYMTVYRWFTDISGLGLSMQAAKLMNPYPVKQESEI